MLRFLLTRVSLIIPTFIGITLVAFFLIRLVPGDPIETMAGERGIDAATHAKLLKDFGLDQPLYVQYGYYIDRVLHGDLGKSIVTRSPVITEFKALFPATIELGTAAILFALLIGLPAGMLAAIKRNSIFDHGVDGAIAHRLFHADLLVGPAADPVVLGAVRHNAGLRPHRGAAFHPAGHRLPSDRHACSWATTPHSARRSGI